MPVNVTGAGRREMAMSFELPGTPEQVWQAIATGPGISSWFVPSTVEERVGGAVTFDLGEGMISRGHITAWEPLHRVAYEEPGWSGEAPPLATEFIIEARAGGTCTVRLVHSLFSSSADWDDQIESMETGWPPFFDVLRVYLTHFAGQRAASVRLSAVHPGPEAAAWQSLAPQLGLDKASVGERRTAPAGAPDVSGVVERSAAGRPGGELMLRMDAPAPGVALFGAFTWNGKVQIAISLYFYGDAADAVVAREEPIWKAWLSRQFSS